MSVELMQNRMFTNLVDLLQYRAVVQPELKLYTYLTDGEDEEVSITAAELNRRAMSAAAELKGLEQKPETALLLFPPGLDFIAGFMGCLYAGVIAIPAYPPHFRRPTPRLDSIIHSSGTTVALTTGQMMADIAGQLDQTSRITTLRLIAVDRLKAAGHYACEPCSGGQLAFLQYTSGSTGNPKGVMVTHGNLLHNMGLIAKYFRLSPQTKIVNWLPAYHDMGLIGQLLMSLMLGCELAFMSPVNFIQKPIRWLKAITKYGATYSGAPNFAYELCVSKFNPETDGDIDLSSWELAFNGAEPVREETLRKFVDTFAPYGFRANSLAPSYGLAEGTLYVSGCKKEEPYTAIWLKSDQLEQNKAVETAAGAPGARPMVACGIIVPEQRTIIVDPQTHIPCGEMEVGEIWVSGPSVAQGYWRNPEASEEDFGAVPAADSPEGRTFLRTGDLGFIRQSELFVTGRIKDVLIVAGRNHYPQDLELTIQSSHPAIRNEYIAVFQTVKDDREIVVAVAELNREHRQRTKRQDDLALLRKEVLAAARTAVAEAHELMLDDVVLIKTGTIPKTSSGKIQRRLTKSMYEEQLLLIW
ncbi:fatty acyl-AMP ligase [Paenibacillus sp. N4]|uniref:fatty acyl-AMP ligase n=1 Tax=Paenibacillus vietnamensis TaxID=2590547 RepID=UPI001CD0B229|nr:fatty acyl-AMP ligase [Paenibacillus vietnamensis]MCA0757857.1 fatty acyl-AMP ligase [Paenibacillus vietnamensis]